MDNLDQLADDELRLRLVQYGFPNLPVTTTTRKILIKKLRHHIDSEKQKLRRESSKAARYSSGEESDTNDGRKTMTAAAQRKAYNSGSSTTRSQRATVAGPAGGGGASGSMPPPPPSTNPVRSSMTRVPISISSPSSSSSASSPVTTAPLSVSSNSYATANGAGSNNHHRSSSKPSSPAGSSSIYISPLIVHDSEEEDYLPPVRAGIGGGGGGGGGTASLRSFGSLSSTPTSHSSLFRKSALSGGNITPPSANSSMYSNIGGVGGDNNSSSGGSPPLNDSNGSNGASTGDSPYVSEYTKRLMQLRGETVSQENYNSAIGGIIGRRSVGANNMPSASRYSATAAAAASSSSHLHSLRTNHHQQPSSIGGGGGGGTGGLLHHPMRSSHPHLLNSKGGALGGGSSPSPLGSAGTIIAGNHIRQRYSRLSGTNEFNENDIVTHAQPSPEPPSIPFRVKLGNFITRLDEHYGFKQTFIPCALLCLLVVFLCSVAFMYMTISTDLASTLSSINTRYELCDGDVHGLAATGCVHAADVEPALELLKLIGTELKARVEQHHCRREGDAPPVSGLMSAGEVLKYAKEHSPSVLIPQLTRHLHAMEYLIDRNPQWHINHCDANGEPITYDGVLERRATRSNHFTILKPKLPFTCMIYNKFQKFFVIVGGLALVTIVTLALNYFIKFVLYVKQKRRDQVNRLISEIIHAVSQAAANASDAAANKDTTDGGAQQAGVVINHLRDRLLGMTNRRKLAWAWNEALDFLEQHESRIAFEVASIAGEDFRVMRWIDTAPLASSGMAIGRGGGASSGGVSRLGGGSTGSSTAKKWQSPAFDNSNKIHDPPTPCLKIRQMFDKYEVNDPNLKTIVQDAILEKVGGRCKIYDIQLDRSSCCVYVRCASAKDAGIVHDEINGWWFDNRLVSIKFLRLERYLQRFPRSLAGPACLKPSNKNNSSMSHQLALNNNNNNNNGGPAGRHAGSRAEHDGETDPEDYDDGEGEEDGEEEEEDEELIAAAARAGSTNRAPGGGSGRRSGAAIRRRDEYEEDDE
uniref:LEM domain-containing protein 2 n=1 Tax=Anopheles quadriannulatus TaxID=34691 RepID=A0A182X3U0_ANOQN